MLFCWYYCPVRTRRLISGRIHSKLSYVLRNSNTNFFPIDIEIPAIKNDTGIVIRPKTKPWLIKLYIIPTNQTNPANVDI